MKPTPSGIAQKPIAEDRTPAEAPAGLVMQAHGAAPRSIARSVRAYLPANAPALDPRQLIAEFGDGALDHIVDVDKPADVAMTIPEQGTKPGKPPLPNIAFAVGVEDNADIAGVLKGVYTVEVRPGGVLELIPIGSKTGRCVVAPAIGPAKHRLICALEGPVAPLVPWLARGVTRNPEPASPVHVELDVARVRKVYQVELDRAKAVARGEFASEIKTGFTEIDRVLKTWAKAGIDEAFDLLEDLDKLTLDVALPAEGAQPSLGFTFASTKSWSARLLLAGGDAPAGTAPKTLGKLPADGAWLAGYSRATPQSDALITPFQTALKDAVDALASDFKWPKGDHAAALDLVKALLPSAADTSFVSGNMGKIDLPDSAPKSYGIGRAFAEAFLHKTFTVSVVEREAKAPIALAKAFAAWIVRPSVVEMYRKLTKDKMTAKISVKPLKSKDLPKGSFAQTYELQLGVNPEDKKGKVDWVAKLSTESVIVPEGATRTYVGFGQNLPDGEVLKKVQAAMAGASGSLSTVPGFTFVTDPGSVTGGMMLVDGTAKMFDKKSNKVQAILAKLPDQGKSAFGWRVTAQKPPKAVAEIAVHIPRDAISAGYLMFAPK